MKIIRILLTTLLCLPVIGFCRPGISMQASWADSPDDVIVVILRNDSNRAQVIAGGFAPWVDPIGNFFLVWAGDASSDLTKVSSSLMGQYRGDDITLAPGESVSGTINVRSQLFGNDLLKYEGADFIFWRFEYPKYMNKLHDTSFEPAGGYLSRAHFKF